MKKAQVVSLALIAGIVMAGCAQQTRINSYELPGGVIGGDQAKNIAPVENIIVWPMANVASGSKAKGIELVLTDYLIDTLYLENTFKSVYIMSENEAKDILARAGEELGLKKKPKEATEGGLVMTKVGQLTGTEAILLARVDDYDEVKVDKATYTTVFMSFFLYDAREQSYPALDSFTPVKTLWRTNAVRTSKETAFQARAPLHDTARILIGQIVKKLENDLGAGAKGFRRKQARKIKALQKEASKQRKDGKYDEAIASWNEILKLDPQNTDAPKAIEKIQTEKKEAEEREKAEQLKEQIAGLKEQAEALEDEGDLAGAKEQWQKVMELDAEDKDATERIEKLDEAITAEEATRVETEKAKNLHLAQKALGEMKYTESIAAARRVLEVDPENAKAKEILEAAQQKLEEARAAEGEVESVPIAVPPEEEAKEEAPPPEPKEAVEEKVEEKAEEAAVPEASSEVEELRNQAMEYFNGEDYQKAEETWKKLLEIAPDDKQAQEMLETTQMLIEALK